MKIMLIDIDSKIPNLALMKISSYYKNQGHDVGFQIKNPDKIYISCIFEKNASQVEGIKRMYPSSEIVVGGSGINNIQLPDDIEYQKPNYDLYPSEYMQGYTTRGCVRDCPWCIVRKKEGHFRRHQHIKDFYDPRFDMVMIMDNNWLADKKWFMETTDFILENKLKVIDHGMDIKLLDKEIAQRLKELNFSKGYKFAFDQTQDEKAVRRGIEILNDAGIRGRDISFYVLAGFNTTHQEDLARCQLLKNLGVCAFIMPYKNDKFIKKLARWSNKRWLYWSCSFEEYAHKKL
jgi:hypothetical protein